jgi:hypothetical protein
VKPRIARRSGLWEVGISGEVIYRSATLREAFINARFVWRHL